MLMLSVPAGIISLVALSIDAHHAVIISTSGCYNLDGQTWGQSKKLTAAYGCPVDTAADCMCAAAFSTCYTYYLSSGSNCGTLFSTYYGELTASAVFGAVLCFLCFLQFMFCLVNISRPNSGSSATAQGAATTPVTTYVIPANGAPGLVPGGGAPAPVPYQPYYPTGAAPPGMVYGGAPGGSGGGGVPQPYYVSAGPGGPAVPQPYYPGAGAPQPYYPVGGVPGMIPPQQQQQPYYAAGPAPGASQPYYPVGQASDPSAPSAPSAPANDGGATYVAVAGDEMPQAEAYYPSSQGEVVVATVIN